MTTERVGLVIGADASQFRREFQGASREIEKLDRVLNRGSRDGIFSKQDAKDYDAQLSKVRGSVGRLAREYQFVTREVRQMEKEQQKLIASGQKVGQAQKQQLSDLRAAARAQHHALLSAQSQVGGIQGVRDEVGTQSGIGAAGGFIAKKIGPLALAYGAYRAGSWIKSQADQGYSTALQNEMARMQVGRLAGRDPRSGMYRRARGGLERYGRSLAYTTAETLQMHQAGLQASGVLPWNMAKRNLAMIRGYSLDPGTLFGYQSATRHAGGMMGGGDPSLSLLQGRRMGRFARSLGNEFARSVTGLLSSVSGSRARIGSSVIPGLLGMMGRGMGREFQQSPARTANLLSGLHGTMRSPGGGEAGQALMLRAMGFGKPGVDYLTAYNRARRGIAGKGNIQ
ncbi:MAG: hypothetical protein U9Q07_06170, partial [Planctomycetota bacterium]|nr:hypothetical protein [Planctomycetota bacterium]